MLGVEELYAILRDGRPHREVYRAQDGSWWVTYGGGEASRSAVAALVKDGRISSKYSNIPTEVYHIGPTIDCTATADRRKKEGRKAAIVYVASGKSEP